MCGLFDRDRLGAGFGGETFESFGTAGVGYKHFVAEGAEATGEGATNVTGTNDSDFHESSLSSVIGT